MILSPLVVRLFWSVLGIYDFLHLKYLFSSIIAAEVNILHEAPAMLFRLHGALHDREARYAVFLKQVLNTAYLR